MRECGVTANKQSRELGHECDWEEPSVQPWQMWTFSLPWESVEGHFEQQDIFGQFKSRRPEQ